MTTSPKIPSSLLAGVFESLVAAIYLDAGDVAVRPFIERCVMKEIEDTVEGEHGGNYKSLLQQFSQREHGATPTYQLLDEKGPDHSKCFKISAQIGSQRYAPAWGSNKKEAEQRAALNALSELNGLAAPHALICNAGGKDRPLKLVWSEPRRNSQRAGQRRPLMLQTSFFDMCRLLRIALEDVPAWMEPCQTHWTFHRRPP